MPKIIKLFLFATVSLMTMGMVMSVVHAEEQSGSVGIEGTVSTAPPSQAATISFPVNGARFDGLPITVTGVCSGDVLVKLFKNNVFSGADQCVDGNFSIVTDLFNGQNDLVARVYDSLDQAGPDSNTVTVFFTNPAGAGTRVSLTSNFSKRGANPGETLNWPIILSGGNGPYAISVDWGDNKTPDLISQQFAGTFNIAHIYDTPGIYNIVIKVTDVNGVSAFLQLVGVGNGSLGQDSQAGEKTTENIAVKEKILWQPSVLMIPLLFSTFWLGKRYELYVLRRKMERGENHE